jgi:hypothetical protein
MRPPGIQQGNYGGDVTPNQGGMGNLDLKWVEIGEIRGNIEGGGTLKRSPAKGGCRVGGVGTVAPRQKSNTPTPPIMSTPSLPASPCALSVAPIAILVAGSVADSSRIQALGIAITDRRGRRRAIEFNHCCAWELVGVRLCPGHSVGSDSCAGLASGAAPSTETSVASVIGSRERGLPPPRDSWPAFGGVGWRARRNMRSRVRESMS